MVITLYRQLIVVLFFSVSWVLHRLLWPMKMIVSTLLFFFPPTLHFGLKFQSFAFTHFWNSKSHLPNCLDSVDYVNSQGWVNYPLSVCLIAQVDSMIFNFLFKASTFEWGSRRWFNFTILFLIILYSYFPLQISSKYFFSSRYCFWLLLFFLSFFVCECHIS